ncbi:MAG: hypothetical protein U0Q18_03335 [Bryobacteraceae bacterium]
MSLTETLGAHRRELIAKLSRAYALAGDDPDPAMAELIDILVQFEISPGDGARTTIEQIAGLDPEQASSSRRCWGRSVVEAQPLRAGIEMAANRFGEWLARTTPISRPAFLEFLPSLAPAFSDLRTAGMERILDAANRCGNSEDCRQLLGALGGFGAAGKKNLLRIAGFLGAAAAAGESESAGWIQRMAQAGALEDPGLDRFFAALPDWEALPQIFGRHGWRPALRVAFAAAMQSCSSGEHLLREMPKVMSRMDATLVEPYAADFLRLVDAIGIQVINFGLDRLPGLYRERGPSGSHAFVSAAVDAAALFGRTAGEWFIQGKTQAARQFSLGTE